MEIQNGGIPKHSTQTLIIKVATEIISEINKGNKDKFITAFDFKKAFDSIKHSVIFEKLNSIHLNSNNIIKMLEM